ncbi:MAG TPA: hypothetical protein PLM00_09690 [Spirochaetota bacterium]|nr:hypothetical protein [Spirochaetota bacterium]
MKVRHRLAVLGLACCLAVMTGCRTRETTRGRPASGAGGLKEGDGYRLAGRITCVVKAESPLTVKVEATVRLAASGKIEKVVGSVASLKVTLDTFEIQYDKRFATILAPMIIRLKIPPTGTSLRFWIDRAQGDILSVQKTTEATKLTRAEAMLLGLLGFSGRDEFQPVRISVEKPWPFELVYSGRTKETRDAYTTLTSRIRIKSPETPHPLGESVWVQYFLSDLVPVRTTIQAEFTTRTRFPGGGIRVVVPLSWQIEGVLEYVKL